YFRKTTGYFTFGGEVGWMSGSAFDSKNVGAEVPLNAFAALANITYEYHAIKTFIEFLYASGDDNLSGGHLNGFVALHRNRRPGVILARELLGNYNGNNVAQGSLTAYGTNNTFSGVYYLRPGFRVEWSQAWASGIEVLIARKAATAGDSA